MRIIQVGVGGFGKNWVKWLKENPEVQVVGMVDVQPAALKAACEAGGYAESLCFDSLPHALERVRADAVVCVTPPDLHRGVCVQAMQAGLDVISEKPMANSLVDCKAMLQAARKTRRTCVISQNYRYAPATWTLAELVRQGAVGAIGQVKVDFFMGVDFGGGFRHDMAYPLLVDMSIHHFDLIRFITGLDAVAVRGEAWNPPWSNYKGDCSSTVVFEMNNGARILYSGSWCSKGQFCDWNGNWQIEGDKGCLTYQRGEIQRLDVPERYAVRTSEPVPLQSPPKGAQAFVLDDFIKAVKTGARPKTDVVDNIRSVAMVFAAVQAVKTGRRVPVLDAGLKKWIA